jgi:transposase-like protein
MKDKKLDLPKDFFKQFRSREEFQDFFQSIFKQGVEAMLQAELDEHLGYEKYSIAGHHSGNSRNGSSKKTVKSSSLGDMLLNIPRDRNSEFKPRLIPKYDRMSDKIEETIIGMYSRGMSVRDIEEQVREIYGVDVSEGTISNVTNRIMEHVREWQNQTLERHYYVLWMDGIIFKVRHNSKIVNKTVYLVIGLTQDGMKQVLGMWIAESESAAFWLTVLTDLKNRGVEDINIACTDNLAGFTQAINDAFPKAHTQLCVVHQIRNSCKYVIRKERKDFVADLREIYGAPNISMAEDALLRFEQKWTHKYGYAVKSWRDNWENLTHYFDYPNEIRQIIYTTNIIESLNSTIRKYTRTKTVFPDDNAVLKSVFLAVRNAEKKWTLPIRNWGTVINQFMIIFEQN